MRLVHIPNGKREALAEAFAAVARAPKQEELLLAYLTVVKRQDFVRRQDLIKRTGASYTQIEALGAAESAPDQAVLARLETTLELLGFEAIGLRGKAALGAGDSTVGERLLMMFAEKPTSSPST